MKHLTRIASALLAAAFVLPALAADDVTNTVHNLSTTASTAARTYYVTTGTDEVCVFCHTPHAGNTKVGVALWNKGTPAGPYTMYSSSTLDMTIAGSPQGVSLACLSCHDGTLALDNMINGPGSGHYTASGASQAYTWNSTNTLSSGVASLGTDLSNDHPISITYDNTVDTAFNSAASVTAAGLPLYGASSDQVECATCHNPHEATLPTFYRMDNAGSAMCTTCHIK
jgi:predicted CXXCH cytochrome family protein